MDEVNRHCQFMRDGHCGFRNIGCKVWLCETAKQECPECLEDLTAIEAIAFRHGLMSRPLLRERYRGRDEELRLVEAARKDGG